MKKTTVNLGKAGKIKMKEGGLHASLHISADKKIPKAKIAKATHSNNPKIAKQANLAQTFAGFKKK